jgi:hypothetical protein
VICACGYAGLSFDCPVHGPCQGCWEITGRMMAHDGTCDGLTAENQAQMRVDWLRAHSVCPECRAGKHGNCDGEAWDDAIDAPTACHCPEPVHGS